MPLSFAAILGGMTTLVRSSTNLLVAGAAGPLGIEIGFFDFTVPGIVMAVVGLAYVIYILPLMLKPRSSMAEQINPSSGK